MSQTQFMHPQVSPAPAHWKQPKRHSEGFYIVAVTLIVIGVLALINVLPMLLTPAGTGAAGVSAFWAFLPVLFTLFFVWIIDRWEPEPRWLYIVAFLWGGGVSVMAAAFLNGMVAAEWLPSFLGADATFQDIQRYTASWGAPIVEEFVKGLGVIVIFFAFRRYFNGPVDGIVYGALIGAGFAFTENILYFASNYEMLDYMFEIRVLDGPLSHDVYTAFFGFFIGFAEYSRTRLAVLGWFIPAMIGSGFFHWFNNDALYWDGMTYETYKFVNNVPVAALAIAMILFARKYEKDAVLGGLKPFVQSGWVEWHEVDAIKSLRSRREAKAWADSNARALGARAGTGSRAMERFQLELIQLGHDHTRAARRGILYHPASQAAEKATLERLNHLRHGFGASR